MSTALPVSAAAAVGAPYLAFSELRSLRRERALRTAAVMLAGVATLSAVLALLVH